MALLGFEKVQVNGLCHLKGEDYSVYVFTHVFMGNSVFFFTEERFFQNVRKQYWNMLYENNQFAEVFPELKEPE